MASSTWQPTTQGIEDIVNTLTQAQTTGSKEVFDRLESFKRIPDYNKYLLFIFLHMGQFVPDHVRSVAGLTLKNNLLTNFEISEEEQTYLKQEALRAVGDPSDNIRKTGASLITTIIGLSGFRGWPTLLPFLAECLGNTAPHVVSGAFFSLKLICEDHCHALENDPSHPLNALLPKFLQFFRHPDVDMRRMAIDCIFPFLVTLPVTLVANMQSFMAGFFYLGSDPDPSIQKKIILAFRCLAEGDKHGITNIEAFLPQMMDYILVQMNSPDTTLVLAACEFWRCLSQHETICNSVVAPHLPKILPVLLSKMVYTEEDLADLGSIDEDAHIPDKQEDIHPSFGRNQQKGGGQQDIDDGTDYQDWTVRKCAAEGLDFLSRPFKRLLPVFLPLVEKGLQSPEWRERESSILALGCVSHGQSAEMKEHLPKLIPFLFDLTRDPKPLIRSITCWVLARYAQWIIQQSDKSFFNRLVGELLTRINDKNKEAQKAACAGLAQVAEAASIGIAPYALAILTEFSKAFDRFQNASLYALYDAIGAVTVAMGPKINEECYLSVILPPLLKKWDSLLDDDPGLFRLFDCLAHVAIALKKGFTQYTLPIFNRCLKIIENSLLGFAMHQTDPAQFPEPPDSEFLTCPMDLLGSLCEALEASIGDYVRPSKLVPLIFESCKLSHYPYVCQSAFALVGDLARRCPDALQPYYIPLLGIFLAGTHSRHLGMCNNAFWAAGEIIVAMTPTKPALELQPALVQSGFIEKLMIRAIDTLDDHDDLMETVAVVIGRICWVCPTQSLHYLKQMNKRILFIALRNALDEKEKADALRGPLHHTRLELNWLGICEVLSIEPELAVPDFALVLEMLGHWHDTKRQETSDLVNAIGTLLHRYKNSSGDFWVSVFNKLPNHLKTNFSLTYGL